MFADLWQRWRLVAALVAVLVVGVAVLAWTWWPSQPAPRARQYVDVDACMLTDAQGLAGAAARPVWDGMQDASGTTHARVFYLAVPGPATKENALPYLTSLVQRRCVVIFAVGPAQVAAADADAAMFPKVRFAMVGGQAQGANVTHIDASSPDGVRAAVRELTTAEVRKALDG
jgi:basic membrane lipoprotein Med (substrate-binding protein (PBP1-ABC) superfamily)